MGRLHDVVEKGDLAATQDALAEGEFVNQPDSWFGRTPLHWASVVGHHEVTLCLLKYKASTNKQDLVYLHTPLHEAAYYGHKECCQSLLKHGANIHIPNVMGRTAIDLAKMKGHDEVVELLNKPQWDRHSKFISGIAMADQPLEERYAAAPAEGGEFGDVDKQFQENYRVKQNFRLSRHVPVPRVTKHSKSVIRRGLGISPKPVKARRRHDSDRDSSTSQDCSSETSESDSSEVDSDESSDASEEENEDTEDGEQADGAEQEGVNEHEEEVEGGEKKERKSTKKTKKKSTRRTKKKKQEEEETPEQLAASAAQAAFRARVEEMRQKTMERLKNKKQNGPEQHVRFEGGS